MVGAELLRGSGLQSLQLHGQGGSVDEAAVADDIAKLVDEWKGYNLNKIYIVDETGLFFRLLPLQTYITTSEEKKCMHGTKQMDAKDHITAYVCTKASGTHKVSMAIIGK